MVDKDYSENYVKSEIHEPKQETIVNTPRHEKRSNIDETGAEEGKDVNLKNVNAENVFAKDEIEITDANGDFGTNAKDKIKASLGEHAVRNLQASWGTNSDNDPIMKIEFTDIATGETLNVQVAFDKDQFEVVSNHLKLKASETPTE